MNILWLLIQWKTAAIKVCEKALYGLRGKDRQDILLSEEQDVEFMLFFV